MTHILLVIVFFVCILDLNEAKKVNVVVTLHQEDVHPLFSEYEIWGIQSKNKTDVVEVNVVIDDMDIAKLQKDIIIAFDIIYADVDKVIQRERYRLNNRTKWIPSMRPDIFFLEYRDWAEYVIFIDYLLFQYPDIASRSYIGETIQGRQIPVITLSTGNENNKAALYIQAAAHAREWLANSATMYILNALLEGYTSNDPVITEILNSINIYIVPTLNIDGYIYSYNVDRFWRKNRRDNGDGSFGVDLNRNYNGPTGTWCTVGASTNPSSNSYCGTAPYSEPEVQAVQTFVFDSTYNIGASVDMHTSGPYVLFPYGYNWDIHVPQPYYDEYIVLSGVISEAIYNVHGVRYTPTQRFGPTSGTMRDYPFAISYERDLDNKIFSFTWEGRGPGFDPPPSNIIPAGQEQLQGMLELAKFVMNRG